MEMLSLTSNPATLMLRATLITAERPATVSASIRSMPGSAGV